MNELDHSNAWNAIPWFVNGTIGAGDEQLLRNHLAVCADCQAELQFQRRLRHMIREAPAAQAEHDVEAGLQALLERLDESTLEEQPVAAIRLRRAKRWALAAMAVAVLQSFALVSLGVKVAGDDAGSSYQLMTRGPAKPPAGPEIRVVPSPSMTVQAWSELLASEGLQVAEGPNTVGAYALTAKPGSAPLASKLARLRSNPSILLAEPIGDDR